MKLRFRADNHALAYVVVPVKGFGSASFMDIITRMVGTSYLGLQDAPGASSCYVAGVVGVSRCIRAASCIRTRLGAIFLM